jgi:CRP/FNR family cyclic AMP-dependent transcriptional regulator
MVDVEDLRKFKLFAGLDDEELAELAKIGSFEKLEAGSEVFEEDEPATTVYVVASGKVSVAMRSRKGQKAVIGEVGPGEMFGWSAALGDRPFTAAAKTIEDSNVLALDGERLRQSFDEHPRIGHRVVRNIALVISKRLTNLRSRLADEPFAPKWLSLPGQEGPVGLPSTGAATEMRGMACPDCGAVNRPRSVVNDTEQYRCHDCGMVYYTSAGCETAADDRA